MQTYEKYNQALRLSHHGRHGEAIALLNPLIAINHKESIALAGDLNFKIQNYEQAYQLALKTLDYDDNDISANAHVATLLYHGELGYVDKSKAFDYYLKAANLGHVGCLARVGNMLELGDGVEVDLEKARKYYRLAGEKGHIASKYLIATTYFRESKKFKGFYYMFRYLIPVWIAKWRKDHERLLFY
ncbi:MAG: sel1 repeat family protein [Gammaproteobacteria bacterium]|nr:sel1 repeat family protein [Gammaproteobacteria bacterium]NNM14969.1 sel1 repeat family protein [Gammaproteobacteria bacterium]